ncbi:MAG TPA: AMP-binding protein [Acidimicrobiales bacterium]|nr:AMP-binding protein [Acidimicrobiales bacterium]HLN43502.1 AMP-binding protein [Acidimicrobiales bacterium]
MTTLLTDHLRAMAAAFPDKVAYQVTDGGQMTFAEWEAESNRLARALVAKGVAKGDRVSIYLLAEEALRFMVAYSAVHKVGAVAVPTNTRLSDGELERLLGHAEVRVLLTDPELSPLAHRLAGTLTALEHVIVTPSVEDGVPPWKWAVPGSDDAGTFQVEVSGDDLADILYTSGTTGLPKGVAIRHRNVALIPGAPNPNYSGQCWLHASPLFTFAGIGFIYNPMQLGLFGVYQPKFDAGRWLEVVEELRPQFVFLVPSMAQLIVSHPRFDDVELSSIAICAIGSAPLAPATLRALQERMPEASVSNSYGMTEAGPAFCSMPKGESLKRIGSVGQPVPPLEVRIVDEEGRDLPSGEVGEAILRMPGREREYYRNAEATAGTWKDGWLYSGDLARLDEDGYLYIVGRKKDVIIRGGNNIYAVDVEAVLLEHPQVVEAAVVGIPHTVLGEDVAAVVVLVPGAATTAEELREHCAGELADYKVPRRIEMVTELPRNATGKVLKARLQDQLAATPPR